MIFVSHMKYCTDFDKKKMSARLHYQANSLTKCKKQSYSTYGNRFSKIYLFVFSSSYR